jgi:hypothetical protein
MIPGSRTCIFCGEALRGRRERSNEHIFPDWLQQYLGLRNQALYEACYNVDGKRDTTHLREHTFHSHVSGLVCSRCNQGWLSELENQTKPLLIPLVEGTREGYMTFAECRTIAEWLYKTALTLHSVILTGDSAIPGEHYASFFRKRSIPEGVFIAIAPISVGSEDDLYWIQNEGWIGTAKSVAAATLKEYFMRSYKITMRAGRLAWRVMYLAQENVPRIDFFEYRHDAIQYIHPCGTKGITWPASAVMENLSELDTSLIYRDKLGPPPIPPVVPSQGSD